MDKGGTAMKRWKKMMAFCFAFLMAFVMFGSSVEAANGPNEQDWSSAYIVIDDGSANPKQLYNANKSVTRLSAQLKTSAMIKKQILLL